MEVGGKKAWQIIVIVCTVYATDTIINLISFLFRLCKYRSRDTRDCNFQNDS